MAKLIVSLDGTWKDPTDAEEPGAEVTNVLKMHRMLSTDGQLPFYLAGPGNESENGFWGKIMGGVFGRGAHQIRDRAYSWLYGRYEPGDEIYLFGFSRGAAIARMLAYKIWKKGVDGHNPPIIMLGCWDTVAAFGIPVDILGIPFQRWNLFTDLNVAPTVQYALHLLALDETRDPLKPSQMNARPGIQEIWLPGGHSDVGGGYQECGLSNIALRLMMEEAELCGLEFRPGVLEDMTPNPLGPMHLDEGEYKHSPRLVSAVRDDRPIDTVRAVVHESVYDRMQGDAGYRPDNLPDGYQMEIIE